MREIPTGELHHAVFEAGKSFLKGEPFLQVLLLLALSVGGMFLKNYMERIRETRPYLFGILLTFLCLLVVFCLFMWISEWKS